MRLLRFRMEEIGGAYDLVVDFAGDFQSLIASRLSGARYMGGRGIRGFGFRSGRGVRGDSRVQSSGEKPEFTRVCSTGSVRDEKPQSGPLARGDRARGALLFLWRGTSESVFIGIHPGVVRIGEYGATSIIAS